MLLAVFINTSSSLGYWMLKWNFENEEMEAKIELETVGLDLC